MNTQDAVLAGRYAKAYLEAAQDAKAAPAAREDLRHFVDKLREDAALAAALRYPLTPPAQKKQAALKALGKTSPTFNQFLELLFVKKRVGLIESIYAHFEDLWDQAAGRVRMKVTSAQPLGKTETAKLSDRLAKMLKKEVALTVHEDASLIGGLVLQSGDRVWDLSLKGRLETLAERLAK